MSKKEMTVVGSPYVPGRQYVEGSKVYKASCGHLVSITPAGQKRLREACDLICLNCYMPKMKPEDLGPLDQEQLDEISKAVGRRVTQEEVFTKFAKFIGWI